VTPEGVPIKILVVDDDRLLADLVGFAFQREGYEVIQAHDGNTALLYWEIQQPDLIILDVNLPDQDGFAVCRQVRQQADTPIILLTVRSEEDDIVQGLEIGADDYVCKPFSPRQLVARAQAALRRANSDAASRVSMSCHAGELTYDASRREVQIGDGEPIGLAPLENRLLGYLMMNAGTTLLTDAIIEYIWGPHGGDSDMVRQLIYRLRAKIEPGSAEPHYIKNVSGLGYGLFVDGNG
jgi:DNA-binding response OmpR family regulator